MKPMSPARYVAQHEITRRLRNKGVTPKQLNSVHFKKDEGDEFAFWRVVSLPLEPALFSDVRAYCTLRWLILENPPESRDTRDAWEHIRSHMAHGTYQAGESQQWNLAAGRRQANQLRANHANEQARGAFREWQRRVASQLRGKDLAACVASYFTTQQPSERERRRVRALLRAGTL